MNNDNPTPAPSLPTAGASKLPESLSPFFTNHPASCAYWITASPHEWVWKQSEQKAMAMAIVQLDAERAHTKRALADCVEALKEAHCPHCNGGGVIMRRVSEYGEPEPEQCRWCDDREQVLAQAARITGAANGGGE